MSNIKSVPLSARIKKRIKSINLKKGLRTLVNATLLLCASSMLLFVAMRAPQLHDSMIRGAASDKVFIITNFEGAGGGTGFQVTAPSGNNYIVTNSHVCEGLMGRTQHKDALMVINDGVWMPRRIIEISRYSDLCIMEGMPGVKGLTVGDVPSVGEPISVLGHPHLRPISLSNGDIVGSTNVAIPSYVMPTGQPELDQLLGMQDEIPLKDDKCDLPKNVIQEFPLPEFFGGGAIKVCFNVTYDSYMSTAIIYPGNSGSPVFDWYGSVVGVAFASDETNWAYIVSLRDLKFFLSKY